MEMRWLAHQSICQGERQTSFLQMHPSDKTCRIRAVVNLSESYFWIYYNQPYQLISYLQHINEPGKDKYIKPCQTCNLIFFFFSHEGCISLQFYFNSWVKAVQLGLCSWKVWLAKPFEWTKFLYFWILKLRHLKRSDFQTSSSQQGLQIKKNSLHVSWLF